MKNITQILLIVVCILSILLSFAAFYISANAITEADENTEEIKQIKTDMHYLEKSLENKQDTIVINTYLNIKK